LLPNLFLYQLLSSAFDLVLLLVEFAHIDLLVYCLLNDLLLLFLSFTQLFAFLIVIQAIYRWHQIQKMVMAAFVREGTFSLCPQMCAEYAIQTLIQLLLFLFYLVFNDFGE